MSPSPVCRSTALPELDLFGSQPGSQQQLHTAVCACVPGTLCYPPEGMACFFFMEFIFSVGARVNLSTNTSCNALWHFVTSTSIRAKNEKEKHKERSVSLVGSPRAALQLAHASVLHPGPRDLTGAITSLRLCVNSLVSLHDRLQHAVQ